MTGVGGAHDLELDLRADEPAQHRFHAADDVAEREQPRPRRLPPAEREQLPRQAGAALDRLLDLDRFAARRVVGPQLHQEQVGRAHDAHQDVVEVVRDAAGEPADRLELLRLPQLLFERAPLGDVADEAGHRRARLSPPTRATVNSTGNSVPSARIAGQLELPPGQRSAAGGQVLAERVELRCAIGRRQQQSRRCGRGCRVRR